MTTTTLSFAPIASRERRVSPARVDHWFKRAPQPQSADLQVPAEISTARIDHWFRDQAKADEQDDAEALFNAELALMTGEFERLLSSVTEALGGELNRGPDLVDQAKGAA